MNASDTYTTTLMATLPTGNKAIYELQPQQVNRQNFCNVTLNQIAIDYGRQIAHSKDGRWYRARGWEEISDPRMIQLLEQTPQA